MVKTNWIGINLITMNGIQTFLWDVQRKNKIVTGNGNPVNDHGTRKNQRPRLIPSQTSRTWLLSPLGQRETHFLLHFICILYDSTLETGMISFSVFDRWSNRIS